MVHVLAFDIDYTLFFQFENNGENSPPVVPPDSSSTIAALFSTLALNPAFSLNICTRNPPHIARKKLEIIDPLLIRYIDHLMADYRNKEFQIQHIIKNLETRGKTIESVLFIDDWGPNLDGVLNHFLDASFPVHCIAPYTAVFSKLLGLINAGLYDWSGL